MSETTVSQIEILQTNDQMKLEFQNYIHDSQESFINLLPNRVAKSDNHQKNEQFINIQLN